MKYYNTLNQLIPNKFNLYIIIQLDFHGNSMYRITCAKYCYVEILPWPVPRLTLVAYVMLLR